MTFLAPGFLFASMAIAAAVAALHFIVTRQPRAGILPTARFVPDMPATATARATRPSDLLLMLLRMLIVLAAGAGLAKPILKPSRGAEARVILADVSRSLKDVSPVIDSVRALYRPHDVIIAFDSSARVINADSAQHLRRTNARGNISAALVAALRAGSSLRERADSVELVIVSSLGNEEIDAATDSIRSLWPGRARLVLVSETAPSPSSERQIAIRTNAGDPLAISVSLANNVADASALIARVEGTQSSEVTLVEWPIAERPRGSVARSQSDTVGGVTARGALVIAPFERRWTYPADSIRGAEVVARWIDGEPAAVEFENGASCTRSVAIPVTAAGDLVIRRDFVRFVAALSGECVSMLSHVPADQATITRLTGNGGLVPREAFRPRGDVTSDIAPWLIGLAIVLAIVELFVRRRRAVSSDAVMRSSRVEKRAA